MHRKRVDHTGKAPVVPSFDAVVADPGAFGRELLGPVIADYLLRLHGYVRYFGKVRDAKPLFVSRAGVRIRRALEQLQDTLGLEDETDSDFFWISRLMVAKGTWRRNRDNTLTLLESEFHNESLRDFAQAMFRHEGLPPDFPVDDPALDANGGELRAFMEGSSPAAQNLATYFDRQAELFEEYLATLMKDRQCALLVDTGWAGTGQRLLADAFSEVDWWGCYFGRYGFEHTNRKYWRQMIGLVFEQDEYEYEKPETCVILHRHMIEGLFEPAGESIERLERRADGAIFAPEAKKLLADAPTPQAHPIFCGVMEYLCEMPDGGTVAEVHKAARAAWWKIARIVTLPRREETRLFVDVVRSADFGLSLKVPLLLSPRPRHEGDTPEERINESLWQPGQIALEYPREMADPLQRKLAGLGTFDFRQPLERPSVVGQLRERPAVAVITRTLDRPMFLRRALRSVAAQTFEDYVHVVVCDGGDIDLVKQTIEETDCKHHRILLVDNVVNRGMEAASNIAIQSVDSEYIVIHDDDDTWEPDFLKEAVAFLDGAKGSIYGGVITKSTYVSEEVTPEGIVIHGRWPYHDWVQVVHIMQMAIQNFFPPIAFLFKREIYDKIGGFNEEYPVLGDWDFNLRFLMEADIGVLPKALANYHHRDRGNTTLFGNTVIAGHDKHLEYSAIVRNRLTRHLVGMGNPAVATLAGLGLHFDALRSMMRQLHDATTEHRSVIENISPQVQAVMNTVLAHDGTLDSDDYWVAMSRLKKAVINNDIAVLTRIGWQPEGVWRRLFRRIGRERDADDATGRLSLEVVQYLTSIKKKGYELEPPPDFDDSGYLAQNPDVAAEVERGNFTCGFEHYYLYGRSEGRQRTTKRYDR